MRCYNLETKEVVTYLNDVPQEILDKRNMLPIKIDNVSNEEGTKPAESDGFYIEDCYVREVRNSFYHVDTLEEVKEKKIIALKEYVAPKFPLLFKQINAILGEYDSEKNDSIKEEVKDWRTYINIFESQILALNTIEEINNLNFTTN